jgi:hypothetical protein
MHGGLRRESAPLRISHRRGLTRLVRISHVSFPVPWLGAVSAAWHLGHTCAGPYRFPDAPRIKSWQVRKRDRGFKASEVA